MGFFIDEDGSDAPATTSVSPGFFIDEDPTPSPGKPIDYQNEVLSVGNRLVNGAGNILDFAETAGRNLNPLQAGGPRLFGLNENLFNQSPAVPISALLKEGGRATGLYGDETAQTPGGKIASAIMEQVPGMVIPGGTQLQRTSSAVGAGLGGGITDALGGSEGEQAIAALFGGLSTSVPSLAKSGWNAISDLFSPTALAQKEFAEAGGRAILNVADDATNPLAKFQTVAEATQNPTLAQLEQTVTKRSPVGNALLSENKADRSEAALNLLRSVSDEPVTSAEAGGQALREIVESRKAAAQKAVEEAYSGITGSVPLAEAGRNFTALAQDAYQAGGMPSKISGLVNEVSKATESGVPLDFDYVHALRKRAQQSWADLRAVNDSEGARVANSLVKGIDGAIEDAGQAGTMKPEAVRRFFDAKSLASDTARTFDKAIGSSVAKMGENNYMMDASSIPASIFNGRAEGTKRLLKAIGDDPEAISTTRGVIRDRMLRELTTNDGNLKPGGFRTWLTENKPALSAEYEGRKLFEPEHLTALENIADDLKFLDGQSRQSVKALGNVASAGQSTTAQALLIAEAGGTVASKIPLAKPLLELRRARADAILSRVMLDKDAAKIFASKPTPESLSAARAILRAATPGIISTTQQGESESGGTGRGQYSQGKSKQPPSPQGELKTPRANQTQEGSSLISTLQNQQPQKSKISGVRQPGELVSSSRSGNTVSPTTQAPSHYDALFKKTSYEGSAIDSLFGDKKMTHSDPKVAKVESQIDADPYYSTLYEIESGRNPAAKNKDSSAAGGFQLIKATQKALGVDDPYDLGQSFKAVKELDEQNMKALPADVRDDPFIRYAAHYLGIPTLKKALDGKPLTEEQQNQVDYLKEKILPKFKKIYDSKTQKTPTGQEFA